MKQGIHPEVGETQIKCACGNVIDTVTTSKKGYSIEICSGCHPFFTGKQKIVDAAGKVEKFNRKYAQFKKSREEKKNQK